jgi:hypothetical protein
MMFLVDRCVLLILMSWWKMEVWRECPMCVYFDNVGCVYISSSYTM